MPTKNTKRSTPHPNKGKTTNYPPRRRSVKSAHLAATHPSEAARKRRKAQQERVTAARLERELASPSPVELVPEQIPARLTAGQAVALYRATKDARAERIAVRDAQIIASAKAELVAQAAREEARKSNGRPRGVRIQKADPADALVNALAVVGNRT